MTRWTSTVCFALALGTASARLASADQAAPADCKGIADCRVQTEAAIAEGDYERAHDLAWRAVQQGRRNDPALMYLLARTQALSGRPDDALVMLGRLAELGVAADASTADFRRTRALPGWPAVEALIARVASAAPPPPGVPDALPKVAPAPAAPPPVPPAEPARSAKPAEPARPAKPAAPARALAPAEPVKPVGPVKLEEPARPAESVAAASIEDAGHFSSGEFVPGGFACDAVSGRFVFGDQPGRKLQILVEGGERPDDLTRAVSAGFLDVMALDIDTTNGTLWVASAEADGRAATLHRLQLVSGRALASYEAPGGLVPMRPVDLTVTASGAVLLLDAAQSRVLVSRPAAPALEVLVDLRDDAPASLAAGRRDGVAYLAHRGGLSLIDIRTRVVSPLTGPAGTALGGIERLRRYATGLVGVQALPDGSRRLVRLGLDAAGRAVTGLQVIDVSVPTDVGPTFAVCGETLVFMVGGKGDQPSLEWTVRRIRLDP